jgi:phosphoribulokinase
MYSNLRLNLFPDPDVFIEKYYKSYTDQSGAILFNYDYKVKYLKIAQTYNEVDGYVDSTDFSQLKFLHGNRVIHVKDWFRKRVLFLDGVYGVTNNKSNIDPSVDSPANQMWSNNKASGTGTQVLFNITMSSSSKILYRWSYDKTIGSF